MTILQAAAPLPEHDTIMVGLFLSSRDALAIRPTDAEVPAGAKREDMPHVTLAVIDQASGSQGQLMNLVDSVQAFADMCGPIDCHVSGVGVFKNNPDAVYASVASDMLDIIQSFLVSYLQMGGNIIVNGDRPFIPHITLFYAPPDSSYNPSVPENMHIQFSQITLAIGNDHYTFPLAGEAVSRAWADWNEQNKESTAETDNYYNTTQEDFIKKTADTQSGRVISEVVNGTYSPPDGTRYVWVGIATNAYQDKTNRQFNVLPLKSLADDIERKALAIKQGASEHYGLLDVMHEHQWTVGVCVGRAIVEGTRMEMDWGYISPEYNDMAEAIVGQDFTMSHETRVSFTAGKTNVSVSKAIAEVLMKTSLKNYLWLDTYRFTIARRGAEANARTYFRVYEIGANK